MLTSQLIQSLQENLNNYGDKPILIVKGKTGYGIDTIKHDESFSYIKV